MLILRFRERAWGRISRECRFGENRDSPRGKLLSAGGGRFNLGGPQMFAKACRPLDVAKIVQSNGAEAATGGSALRSSLSDVPRGVHGQGRLQNRSRVINLYTLRIRPLKTKRLVFRPESCLVEPQGLRVVMKTLTSIGLAISLSTAAYAAPILEGTTTDPTGIDGVVVDSTTYDVTFSTTTLNSFSFPSTISSDADLALASALSTLSVTGLGNASPSLLYQIDVDNSLHLFEGPACGAPPVGCWVANPYDEYSGLGLVQSGEVYLEAADFTVAPTGVPEPFTLSLFGAGLLGMGFIYRRRTVKRA
jgi:hypothetical protein